MIKWTFTIEVGGEEYVYETWADQEATALARCTSRANHEAKGRTYTISLVGMPTLRLTRAA